jgi:rhamnosyltransferase
MGCYYGRKKVVNCFETRAKSLGKYGGYESSLKKLAVYHNDNKDVKYCIVCKANVDSRMVP